MHEDTDARDTEGARDAENDLPSLDDSIRYAVRREGECDVARIASQGDDAPWARVLDGTIWEWWVRTTPAREDYLDGLPSTLTRQERDFVLERFDIDRPFSMMPFDKVVSRREHDEVFGIRYAEFLHRMGIDCAADGSPRALTDGTAGDGQWRPHS